MCPILMPSPQWCGTSSLSLYPHRSCCKTHCAMNTCPAGVVYRVEHLDASYCTQVQMLIALCYLQALHLQTSHKTQMIAMMQQRPPQQR